MLPIRGRNVLTDVPNAAYGAHQTHTGQEPRYSPPKGQKRTEQNDSACGGRPNRHPLPRHERIRIHGLGTLRRVLHARS